MKELAETRYAKQKGKTNKPKKATSSLTLQTK